MITRSFSKANLTCSQIVGKYHDVKLNVACFSAVITAITALVDVTVNTRHRPVLVRIVFIHEFETPTPGKPAVDPEVNEVNGWVNVDEVNATRKVMLVDKCQPLQVAPSDDLPAADAEQLVSVALDACRRLQVDVLGL